MRQSSLSEATHAGLTLRSNTKDAVPLLQRSLLNIKSFRRPGACGQYGAGRTAQGRIDIELAGQSLE
jgi:hypothetical protein